MQTARLDWVGRTSYSLLCLPTASLRKLLSGLLRELVFPPHNCLSSSRTPHRHSAIPRLLNLTGFARYLIRSGFDTTRILESRFKTKSDSGGLERQSFSSWQLRWGWKQWKSISRVGSWKKVLRERPREAVCEQLVDKMFTFLHDFNDPLQPLISYINV